MKTCSTCKEAKPSTDFAKRSASTDGLQSNCRVCDKARPRPQHVRMKAHVKKVYGITLEEYERCMATSPCCEVCSREDDLCYDHSHETGKFRGVLCRTCNLAIGHLGDTLESLQKAVDYLSSR